MPNAALSPSGRQPWRKVYPAGVDWDAPIPAGTMPDFFARAVRDFGDRICLNFLGRRLTYRETGEMADRFARGLQDLGVVKGTRVGLCLPNTPFYVIAYHGALKAGAVVVNFNPLYAEKEIRHQAEDSGIEIMVTLNVTQIQPKAEALLAEGLVKKIIFCELSDALPPFKGLAFRAVNAVRDLLGKAHAEKVAEDERHIAFARLVRGEGGPAPVALSPDDLAVLQYTGGTTGVPKAAMLTHGNLTCNIQQARLWFMAGRPEGGREKMLAVLPFFHVFSMTVQMNLTLDIGGELVMLPRFELRSLLKTIAREGPTIFAGVPTLYKAVTGAPGVKRYDLSSLKICVSGGAPLPDTTRREFKALTGLDLVEGYGLSETSPLATGNPVEGVKKSGSIGLPMPRTEIRITALESHEEVPQGTEGEICIRGPQVMKGYWNNPAETEKVMDAEGFFHTGDIGYMDEDGYVFIVDRVKDMIIASGFKVFPRKVEEEILQHPAVSEVMVAGIKDDYRGETVKAWVVLKTGQALLAGELQAFLKDRLAAYEVPKHIEFRLSLPKTLIGKPDRKALLAEERAKAHAKGAGR